MIEDEESLRRLLARLLARAGYQEVLTAEDGEEGSRIFLERADEIRLVVLDVLMPTRNAGEILPELLGRRPDLPFVLTSGDALPEDLETVLEKTPHGRFLRKPFVPRALLRMLDELDPFHPAPGDC